MLVTIDVPNESVRSLLDLCAAQGIETLPVDWQGPAGGNPRVSMLVSSQPAIEALGKFYFGPNGDFS